MQPNRAPRPATRHVRMISATAIIALAVVGCGPKPVAAPASQLAAAAPPADAQLTAQQLEAKATAAEAEANRLLAAAQPPPAAPAQSADAAGTQTLGPGDETLHSGQFYKAIPIPMNPGDVYQVNYVAHGYSPVIVVLDQDKQPFTQSQAGPNLQPGQPLTTEIRPDKSGTWYVLLSAAAPGAGGSFEVNIQKVTETPG